MSQRNSIKQEPIYKTKVEIQNIKAINLRSIQNGGQNDLFVQFTVQKDQPQKTSNSNDSKNPEWNDGINLYITLEDEVIVQVFSQNKNLNNDLVGQGVLKVRDIRSGKQRVKLDLTHENKSAGSVQLSLNTTINSNYENQTGIKGKLIISKIRAEIALLDQQANNFNAQVNFKLENNEKKTSKAQISSQKVQWNETIEFTYKGDANLNIKLFNADQNQTELASYDYNFMFLLDKQGIFENEPFELTMSIGNKGIIYATVEYRPLEFGGDYKLYQLKRIMGKIKISNFRGTVNRGGKLNPYCEFKLHDQIFKTSTHQEGDQNPKWSEAFTFNLFTYQKNHLVQIDIYSQDSNKNEFLGTAVIECSHFISNTTTEHPNQEVEIQYKQAFGGTFYYTATCEVNDDVSKYISQKEAEEKQIQLEEDAERKKKEEAENKKREEDEKKKKEDEEKKKKEDDEKKKREDDEKKKREDDEKKKKEEDERKNKEEEENKKKQKDDQKNKEDAENKKKEEDEDEKKKQEVEDKQKEQKPDQNKGKSQQDLDKNQSKKNDQNKNEGKGDKQKNNKGEQSKNTKKSEQKNDKTINNQSKISQGSTSKLDYNPATKNLKNGFGLSEFQSAHTLQNSILSASFPKGSRFSSSLAEKNSPPFIILPSSFDYKNKGPSFGCGIRGLLHPTLNPGPGTYEISNTLKKGSKKGYLFGESREHCKNSINPVKAGLYSSQSNNDFSRGLKLPEIQTNNQSSSNSYNYKPPNIPNYHYTKGSKSAVSFKIQ